MPKLHPLKVMVSTTVYGWEDQIEQLSGVLSTYGYKVLNSHIGTIRPKAGQSNFSACLDAVDRCDYFLGIIRGSYGSGKETWRGLADGEISITHLELRRAIQAAKPRTFLVEERVVQARSLLRPFLSLIRADSGDSGRVPQWDFPDTTSRNLLKGNPVIDDLRVLAMYEEALQSEVALADRHDHWCQPFHRLPEVLRFVDERFADAGTLREELAALTQVRTTAGQS